MGRSDVGGMTAEPTQPFSLLWSGSCSLRNMPTEGDKLRKLWGNEKVDWGWDLAAVNASDGKML